MGPAWHGHGQGVVHALFATAGALSSPAKGKKGAKMRKRMAVATTICVVVMLSVGAAAFAGSAGLVSGSVRPGNASPDGQAQKGAVTVGSQWTMYDIQFTGSGYGFGPCEVLTFQSHGTFTGDKGDVGRWSKNIKLTFTNGAFFWPGQLQRQVRQ